MKLAGLKINGLTSECVHLTHIAGNCAHTYGVSRLKRGMSEKILLIITILTIININKQNIHIPIRDCVFDVSCYYIYYKNDT